MTSRRPSPAIRSAPSTNLNAPGQTVIGGHREAVERAVEEAKRRGARKVTLLPVSAPFHSPLMAPARAGMEPLLAAVPLRDPRIPVVCNVDARPLERAADVRDALLRQIDQPVRWVESVECMRHQLGVGELRRSRPRARARRYDQAHRHGRRHHLGERSRFGARAARGLIDFRTELSMFRLDGRTALVTGASQGIGAGIARRLAAAGARVIVAARSRERLEALAVEIESAGGRAFALELDLASAETIADRIATVPEELLPIGILVNNAGITADNLLLRMSLDEWRRVLDTNLTGTFAVTKAVVRGMVRARWGRIVTVSSVVGLMGNAGQANYAAAKAGLIGFSKSLARELGSRNITVNVVAPGFVRTAMTDALSAEQTAQPRGPDRARPTGHARRRGGRGALPGERGSVVRHRRGVERVGRALHLIGVVSTTPSDRHDLRRRGRRVSGAASS